MFHNHITLHPGFRRVFFPAGHCILMVFPSSVASNLRKLSWHAMYDVTVVEQYAYFVKTHVSGLNTYRIT